MYKFSVLSLGLWVANISKNFVAVYMLVPSVKYKVMTIMYEVYTNLIRYLKKYLFYTFT